MIVRPHSDLVDAHYLALLFNSAWGKRTFQRLLVGGAQKVLNVTTVARLEVPVPPMAEQKRIVRVAAQIDAYGDRLVDVAANSRRIRQGLLQDLLSGAHEIPASYDRLLAA